MLKRISLMGAALAVSGSMAASADVKPLSTEDFSKHPALSSMSMSLEGDMLVGVVTDPTDSSRRAAAYWDLSGDIDTTKPLLPSNITPSNKRTSFVGATALKQKKSLWFTVQPYVGALRGCGEGKTTGSTKKYIEKVYMGNERIKKIDDLPDGATEVGANKAQLRCFEITGQTGIASFLPLDPKNILISRASTKNGTSYFRHNLETGKEEFAYKASNEERFQISAEDGMPYAKFKLEFVDGEWRQFYTLLDKNDEFTQEDALTTEIKNRYNLDVLGRQNGTGKYFISTDKFSDKVSVYLYDTETDKFSDQPLFQHPEFDIGGLIRSTRASDFGEILGFTYQGPVSKTYWLDPEMKSIQDGLDAAFPGKNVSLNDYTADRNRVLFSVSAADMPPAHFVLVDKSKVAVIGSERPWINEDSLGEAKFVYYSARDGLQIPAILTMPAGYKPGDKAKGAIVTPHGGPWSRDSIRFDSSGWTQYFASRGYIVMQPQYRGSTGWGRKLWLAGDMEWGQKMQDDKDDGAAWMVQQGYVDADKIAMHGYSYGGFAAIAASVRPNSPYQCAIAGAGVANLAKLGNTWGENRIQRIVQGRTVTGMDPQQNTQKINIPIMLYHGDYDVRVPLFHSRDFYNSIKKDSPESKLIVLKQMGHQSSKWLPEHKATVLTEMEDFLTNTCGM